MQLACTADSANQIYTTEKQLPSAPSSHIFEVINLRRLKVHIYVRTLRHVTDFIVCHSDDTLDLQGYSYVPQGFPNSTTQQPRQTRQKGAYQ